MSIITEDGIKLYRYEKWKKRLKNVPNILAFIRVLMAFLMYLFLVNRDFFPGVHETWLDYFAALIFVIASVTDFFDGYIARNFDASSKLGEILDPLADKMLTLGAFLGLLYLHRANAWAIYLILVREFFITALRIAMVQEGLSVKASFAGKVKTVSQMGAIGFLLMNWPCAECLLWVAVILTLYSGYDYVKVYVKAQR
ncbi:CDP-diacylglycerol--glycerol-3-phosphate 3-phosphatidyltransferase [Nautilia profundicola AmH]|uniref:CDP-diacylglycerol--glycerol-3-phosphate 3-phosphatidyltransferase n=1 Tax=Nautilia profundicola (strain ATCC BAA-1463 / DSM 18972 / AmH) TaxID=598659 RepID=B9L9Q5_NAUPA|nr:CDP-diacylglycerol--glycerol-3-phosphate 3-phosphatidyltransferase [Nautilia profundicola]ACM93409.1 CDP-diacylglycerol--glycerol-3-phosphate 3-phosphatidyltransferase [Nautilia profundicola AmH]